jgi:hypothetical protein
MRAGDGSFSCRDGSEPECEGESTPARAPNGATLVCPVGREEGAGPEEPECEEGLGLSCQADEAMGSRERACQATGGSGASFVCEEER